ncbi:MAG: cobalt transporter [Bacteroidetes bacterium]|nr:cobalt transporter [Bacteroidota bacterium]
MEHNHTHAHEGHHHHTDIHGKNLFWVTLLNVIITVTEIVGGLISGSLALLSDAIHNLGDTLALIFAFMANKMSHKEADMKRTFGYKRVEILTALFNALILIAICLFLFKEAYDRFFNPEPIKGLLMLVVAVIGLLANGFSVLILQKDKDKNINIRAAYLHLLGDTLSSVAVIIGGLAIWLFDIVWIDPLITIIVGVYIIYHAWEILKQSTAILMQSAPSNINIQEIVEDIEKINEIKDIHHIHLWQLNEEQLHFEAHINVHDNIDMIKVMELKREIEQILESKGIEHTTLQMGYQCCQGKEFVIEQ